MNTFIDAFSPPKSVSIYFKIPFSRKDSAKKFRMLWSPSEKLWYKKIDLIELSCECEYNEYEKSLVEILPRHLFEFDFEFLRYDKLLYDSEELENKFRQLYIKKQEEYKIQQQEQEEESSILWDY